MPGIEPGTICSTAEPHLWLFGLVIVDLKVRCFGLVMVEVNKAILNSAGK